MRKLYDAKVRQKWLFAWSFSGNEKLSSSLESNTSKGSFDFKVMWPSSNFLSCFFLVCFFPPHFSLALSPLRSTFGIEQLRQARYHFFPSEKLRPPSKVQNGLSSCELSARSPWAMVSCASLMNWEFSCSPTRLWTVFYLIFFFCLCHKAWVLIFPFQWSRKMSSELFFFFFLVSIIEVLLQLHQ